MCVFFFSYFYKRRHFIDRVETPSVEISVNAEDSDDNLDRSGSEASELGDVEELAIAEEYVSSDDGGDDCWYPDEHEESSDVLLKENEEEKSDEDEVFANKIDEENESEEKSSDDDGVQIHTKRKRNRRGKGRARGINRGARSSRGGKRCTAGQGRGKRVMYAAAGKRSKNDKFTWKKSKKAWKVPVEAKLVKDRKINFEKLRAISSPIEFFDLFFDDSIYFAIYIQRSICSSYQTRGDSNQYIAKFRIY